MSTQSVAFSHYNNITAQLPIDPVSNQIVMGGVQEQTAQCLKNIKAVLTAMDVPFDDIVKVTVFLKDLGDVEAMNEIYKRFFPDSHRPRRQLPAGPHRGRGRRPAAACARADRGWVLPRRRHTRRRPSRPVAMALIIEANNIADARRTSSPPRPWRSPTTTTSAPAGIDPATGVGRRRREGRDRAGSPRTSRPSSRASTMP